MSRESRLLLATIAVAVGMLLLLSRFRFPKQDDVAAQPAQAPLERLAAGATYDELASTMADIEARVARRVAVLRVNPARQNGSFVVAPRLTDDRAVAVLASGERLEAAGGPGPAIVARDRVRELAVIATNPDPDSLVTVSASLRRGPRYVAVVEATARGPVVRPMYVGRTDLIDDPRRGGAVLSVAAVQQIAPRGAAIFSLAGNFIGLVVDGGSTATLLGADILKDMAQAAQPSETNGDIGIDVQAMTPPRARATGTSTGVIVSSVHEDGPSDGVLQPGDAITAVDKTPISNEATVQGLRAGTVFELTVTAVDATRAPPLPREGAGIALRTIPGVGVAIRDRIRAEPRAGHA